MNLDYNNFISRNVPYINQNIQKILEGKKILFAGCGLGSVIAESAVRTGFSSATLVDGDVVELSNLNRQYFFYNDIGKNKARALAANLRSINPSVNLNIHDYFIDNGNVGDLLDGVDFVVNAVDLDEVYFSVIDKSLSKGIPVICPFNIGFGGVILVFNSDSALPGDIWGTYGVKDSNQFYAKLLSNAKDYKLPNYISGLLDDIFYSANKNGYYPQISIGANIVASLVLTTIIKIIENKPVSLAPSIISIDSFSHDNI